MSLGPIIITDKSALQALSVDESCWFDNFFLHNITPLFYIETLADLEKEIKNNKTPEQVVGDLAIKTPTAAYPNIDYQTLVIHDLLGNKVEMSNRPIIGGGETRESPEGKVGVHFNEFPEVKAMNRWQKGEFLEIERELAKDWRAVLSNLSFDYYIAMVKNIVPKGKNFSDLNSIKEFLDEFVKGKDKEILLLLFEILGTPQKARPMILKRWEESKSSLIEFAPYAAYVFKIDLLFYLALDKSFISRERPSNKIDIAYLYYLPFCMVFVSRDKLHSRVAPLFMEMGQTFINGDDLKADMKKLDDYYSKLPDEVKEQGIMRFATYPPEDTETAIAQLWDKYLPIWRKHASEKKTEKKDPEDSKRLVDHLNNLEKNSRPVTTERPVTADEADHVMFQRTMHIKKGKWKLVPPEVVQKLKEEGKL